MPSSGLFARFLALFSKASPTSTGAKQQTLDMASDKSQKLLCLNILGYKKEGIDSEEYRNYMVNVHAPLVAGLMQKYGFLQWSMVSTPFPLAPLIPPRKES